MACLSKFSETKKSGNFDKHAVTQKNIKQYQKLSPFSEISWNFGEKKVPLFFWLKRHLGIFRQLEKNLIENINYSKIETGATTQDDRWAPRLLVAIKLLKSRGWTMLQGEIQMLVHSEAP